MRVVYGWFWGGIVAMGVFGVLYGNIDWFMLVV
jgi:hypothetical protein